MNPDALAVDHWLVVCVQAAQRQALEAQMREREEKLRAEEAERARDLQIMQGEVSGSPAGGAGDGVVCGEKGRGG